MSARAIPTTTARRFDDRLFNLLPGNDVNAFDVCPPGNGPQLARPHHCTDLPTLEVRRHTELIGLMPDGRTLLWDTGDAQPCDAFKMVDRCSIKPGRYQSL